METVSQNDAVQNAQSEQLPGEAQRLITDEAEFALIPLNRLVKSPFNQRKKERPQAAVVSLAVNIKGLKRLLQNLVVHPMKKAAKKAQTYGVAAGETRRLALNWLADQGDIPADYPVRCQLISASDAILASASENDVRNPAHAADQCHAYLALVEEGRSAEHIAEIFNVHPKTVARRLKLANVSPKLIEIWRNDEMEIQQVQALALSDDHETQERVWFSAQPWQRQPHELRKLITQDEIKADNSPLARFVGLENFEQAGGKVRRDLFASETEGWFTDMELMSKLALAKLDEEATPIRAEGWKWVEVRTDFPHEARSEFSQMSPASLPLSDEQQAELQRIEARMDEIETLQEAEGVTDEDYEKLGDELEQLQTRYSEIEDQSVGYGPEVMAHAGVVLSIGRDGVVVTAGLVRADDEPALRSVIEEAGNAEEAEHLTRTASTGHAYSQPAKEKSVHSEKLLLNLTAHRTAAVQSAIAMNPNVALVTILHKLVLDFLHTGYRDEGASVVQVTSREAIHTMTRAAPELQQNEHATALREYVQTWRKLLPPNPNDLFGWLLEQTQDRLLNLLSVCTALSINGVSNTEGPNAINTIAAALEVNLSTYWQPTCESYLSHVSKDRIVAIVSAAVSPDEGKRLSKMKKGEAAEAAEKLLKGKNWLPEFMVAAEAKQIRYYGSHDDDDTDDEMEDDQATGAASDSGDEPANAAEKDAVEVHAGDEPQAWRFPKAADFACETGEVGPEPASVVQAINAVSAPLSPALAWPLPTPNPAVFTSVQKAA